MILTNMADSLPTDMSWIIGTILCIFGFLSSHPMRNFTVVALDVKCLIMLLDSNSMILEGLFMSAAPQPRSHKQSMGQPQFKSCLHTGYEYKHKVHRWGYMSTVKDNYLLQSHYLFLVLILYIHVSFDHSDYLLIEYQTYLHICAYATVPILMTIYRGII